MPADMALAGILGTAYAIAGGLDTDTALALAVPIGILGTIVWAGRYDILTHSSYILRIITLKKKNIIKYGGLMYCSRRSCVSV